MPSSAPVGLGHAGDRTEKEILGLWASFHSNSTIQSVLMRILNQQYGEDGWESTWHRRDKHYTEGREQNLEQDLGPKREY